MSHSVLLDSFDALRACSSLDERWGLIGSLFGSLGYDQINYAVLNVADEGRDTASVTQYSTMDQGWIAHYLDSRLDLHDPHVRFVRNMGWKPYFFDETAAASLAGGERDVIDQAADAGLRAQMSIVFPDNIGAPVPIAGMTIGTSRAPSDFYAGINGYEQAVVVTAMLFHSLSMASVRSNQFGTEPLSARERDALSYVAKGQRVGRIAEKLGISEVTVELHLRNARRKLRAATTAQAIARAMLVGAVSL